MIDQRTSTPQEPIQRGPSQSGRAHPLVGVALIGGLLALAVLSWSAILSFICECAR